MPDGQSVALVMVNKCVMFNEINLNSIEVKYDKIEISIKLVQQRQPMYR